MVYFTSIFIIYTVGNNALLRLDKKLTTIANNINNKNISMIKTIETITHIGEGLN